MSTPDLTTVNTALLLLGENALTQTQLTTQSLATAQIMANLWTPTLDEALQSHNWNFATVRAGIDCGLVRLTCAPIWGFNAQYGLPDGSCSPYCYMILETNLAEDQPWRVEYGCSLGIAYRVFVTDGCDPSILYIGRVDDVTKWSPLFKDAFAWELAYRACYPLTRNATLLDFYNKQRAAAWQLA